MPMVLTARLPLLASFFELKDHRITCRAHSWLFKDQARFKAAALPTK